MPKMEAFRETLKEGRVYKLRERMEPDEWVREYGWLWVFISYEYNGPEDTPLGVARKGTPLAVARSVIKGTDVLFHHDSFEEVSDAGG